VRDINVALSGSRLIPGCSTSGKRKPLPGAQGTDRGLQREIGPSVAPARFDRIGAARDVGV